jgi:GntR family transcriptional regulator/MocR family aminotransferase
LKAIIPDFQGGVATPLYLQLYQYLKTAVLEGDIRPSEKLPSLRSLAKSLGLSLTTVELAYSQLLVEGYIYSKPQSGYYVNQIPAGMRGMRPEQGGGRLDEGLHGEGFRNGGRGGGFQNGSFSGAGAPGAVPPGQAGPLSGYEKIGYYDLSCFDFVKWKKCINQVLTEYPHLLLREGDSQGEEALRREISRYVYQSRGVTCTPGQIVIGAGTQQIMGQLCTILIRMGIRHVAVEEPGYLPVRNIFRDRDFAITSVPVGKEGISITKLPANIRSAVYVSPSNQFPTGSVMPIGKRYELLDWAVKNDSIIIEDDYDSELRYFGKPIPSLQGLDRHQKAVYLGSFSSTLFPSIKISYMVLPPNMAAIFDTFRRDYTQTCSKTEQLTLALYMSKGLYQINIKKLRTLYSQKLQLALSALGRWGADFIRPVNSSSGVNMLISVKSKKSPDRLCAEARTLGISTLPVAAYTGSPEETAATLIFYYNQIPLEDMEAALKSLLEKWRQDA